MKISFFKLIGCLFFMASLACARPVTLTMWIMNNGPRAVWQVEQFTKEFEKTHPNIKVNVELLNWGEAMTKLKIMSEERKGPDITQIGSTWVSTFASSGTFLNLKPYLNLFGGKDAFFESTWLSTHSDDKPDNIVALPWFLDNKLLLVHKEIYDNFGFTEADFRDWKSTKSALLRVRDANLINKSGLRIWPFVFPGFKTYNAVHNLAPWLWSGGGSFLKKTNGIWHSNLSDTNSIEAIKYYISFMKEGMVNYQDLDQTNTYIDNLFSEGKVFLYHSGTGQLLSEARGEKTRWNFHTKYLPIPRSSRGTKQQFSFLGGSNLAITSFSPHKKEALELLKYFLNDKINAEYSYSIGAIGGKRSFRKYSNYSDTTNLDVLEQNVKNGRSYPNTPYWADLVLPFKEGLIGLFLMAGGAYGDYTDVDIRTHTLRIDEMINNKLGLDTEFKELLRRNYDEQFQKRQQNKGSKFSQTFTQKPENNWSALTILIGSILLFGAVVFIKRLNSKE